MTRRFIAAAWIVGALAPMVLATVWMMGCCALPFHAAMHEAMPVCHAMMNRGEGSSQPQTPAGERQEPVKRMLVSLTGATAAPAHPLAARTDAARLLVLNQHRNVISFGAMRCDQDVGLHVLVDTFRI